MTNLLAQTEPQARAVRVLQLLLALSALSVSVSLILRLMWVTGRLQGFDFTINELLNVDAEGNPPTWFGSMMLFSSALLGVVLAQKSDGKQRRAWYILAATMAFMSLDEASSIHEQTGRPLRELFDTSGLLHFAWVLLAIPFLVVVVALLLPLLPSLTGLDIRRLLLAGGLYFSGAIGGEMVSGLESDDQASAGYVLITHIEEGLEFAGAAFLIFALLSIVIRDGTTSLTSAQGSNVGAGH